MIGRLKPLLVLVVIVAACAPSAPARVAGSGRTSVTMNDLCPLYTSGATIEFAQVERGGSLAFTQGASSVSELRERARRVVEMHNERLKDHDSPKRSMGAQTTRRLMPNALASVEDINGGARVVLQPSDPAELDSLREHLQTHSGRMDRDVCPALWREARSYRPPTLP